MAVHLMMYGEIRYGIDVSSAVKGLRVCLRFTSGDELVFLDMSAWTKIGYYSEDGSIGQGMQRRLAMLGHEPLDADLTPEVLRRLFAGETKTVKECLMDHKLIIGIGNAYSDEILWQAGIAPMRQAASLSPEGLHGLRSAMQTVLVEAIDKVRIGLQGQTYGEVRDFLHVHSRPKKKQCDRCGGLIERVEIKTRGSYFCPRCQK